MNKIELCNSYINEIRVIKNLSLSSVKVYTSVIKEFYGYKWDKEGLLKFMNDIKSQRANTKARKITIIKNFLNFCYDRGKIKIKFWEELKAPRESNLPKYLTAEEIETIINNSDGIYRYIFLFLYHTGLRISEINNIMLQVSGTNFFMVVRGKGSKERVLKISKEIYDIYNLIISEKMPSIRSIQRNFSGAVKKAGITKKCSVHTLRHSFAVSKVNEGVPLNVLQSVLGHTNLSTTGIYTKVSGTEIMLN